MKYFFSLLSLVFVLSSFIGAKNREEVLFLATMASVFYGIYAILDKMDKLNKK